MNSVGINHGMNWNQVLETKDSALSFLKTRIVQLTQGLKTQTFTLENTNLLHRIKWVAQIIFQGLRIASYFLLEKCACLFRSKDMGRHFSLQLSDALLKAGSLIFRFKCADELLIASHNSHHLAASSLYLEQDIKWDDKPFDTLQFWGKCAGMCTLFCSLFLKGREAFPSMPMDELIMKIGSMFQHGAPPEASILQNMQNHLSTELFDTLFEDFQEYCATPFSEREFTRYEISEKEAHMESPHLINTLEQLEIGKPYEIFTRVLGRHVNLLIRTAEKEFFWFDPNIGLCVFKGKEGMRRLPKMLGYEERNKNEIKWAKRVENWQQKSEQHFKNRHVLSADQHKVVTKVFKRLCREEDWEVIRTKYHGQAKLVRHAYEWYKEDERNDSPKYNKNMPPNSIYIAPYFQAIARNVPALEEIVYCYPHDSGLYADCEPSGV